MQVNQPEDTTSQLAQLRRDLEEVKRAVGLSSATISRGGLTVKGGAFFEMDDAAGHLVVYIGPDPGGGPSQVFQLWRPGGDAILATQLDEGGTGRYFTAFRDWLGHIIFSDDIQTGGLARPWLSIPLYPMFSVPASSTYSYMTIAPTAIATETTVWRGRIPLVSHPRLSIDGVWGQASGSNSTTYKLYINNVQVGASWTPGFGVAAQGPFDVSPLLDQTGCDIAITATATGTTGLVACQVFGCWLRQT